MKKSFNIRYSWFCMLLFSVLVSCGDSSQYSANNESNVTSIANIQEDGLISKKGVRVKYVQGEILVKFRSPTAVSKMDRLHSAIGATRIKEIRHIGVHHLKLPHDMTVEEAVRLYKADPVVEYAEPNYIVEKAVVPDDPDFNNLWGLNNTGQTGGVSDADIDASEAWDITTGSSDIIIAVLDTGVAYNHDDLSSNIWRNTGETDCADGIDNDDNNYIDDCYGWDFIDNDGFPEDYYGHGTHVAGTIAAEGNNGEGITGVMWQAKIMPVRFLGVSGLGNIADAAEAIIYAADNGARIINASWGGGSFSQTLYDAIDDARSKNVLFVAAAGNEGNNNDINPVYPAGYNLSNVISVTATDQYDNLAYFSNYGMTSVHVAGPGVSIYSTVPLFTYGDPITVYSENFDSDSGSLPSAPSTLLGWAQGGMNSIWAITSGTGVAGNSLEDSPGSNYLSNTNSWAGYMTPVNSVKNNRYKLSFQWKGYVDPFTYDYLNINSSPDGVNWDWVDWTYGDTGGSFFQYSTDELTAEADLYNSFYFGFGLESDAWGNYDGVYIDDVVLTREPISISGYDYESENGTSMAVPHVSGVAGLILSVNPSLTYLEVKNFILDNVDVKTLLSGKIMTGGRLNAFLAVSAAAVPNAPSSLTADPISTSQIDLNWADNSFNETGFKIERKTGAEGSYSEITLLGADITTYTVGADITTYSDTGLSASTTYYYRVKAYSNAGDSSYSNEASATTSGGGGGGGGCFIATAAYGSYLAPEVSVLRRFRDKWLISDFGFRISGYEFRIPNDMGKGFVDLYYRTSPPIADYIARHEGLRGLTRIALTPIVYGIKYPTALFILAGVFVLMFLRRSAAAE